ncbi:hypothetical protein Pint_04735 [Pistacia integerrima]|uniref:Uncharacterized protein n=1 Tax=Pistacia integerrima TaxID=434235 RepID=A0ACC0Z0D4_9ROSI|nr:hypothetical protein Pint_04735 [Pistacia integerrima]
MNYDSSRNRKGGKNGVKLLSPVFQNGMLVFLEIQFKKELIAYENFTKFYKIPYLDGHSHMPNNIVQESVVGDLWSFDDEANAATPLNSTPL